MVPGGPATAETTGSEILAALQAMDRRAVALDLAVWPRIANSAAPFHGRPYDPDAHIPIAEAYAARTGELRRRLVALVGELGDRPAGPEQEAQAHVDMQAVEALLAGYEVAYGRVVALLDGAGGGGSPLPAHLELSPAADPAVAVVAAGAWAAAYRAAAESVQGVLAERLAASFEMPGPADREAGPADAWWRLDLEGGATDHPTYVALVRVRERQVKLERLRPFAARIGEEEAARLLAGLGEPDVAPSGVDPATRLEAAGRRLASHAEALLHNVGSLYRLSLQAPAGEAVLGSAPAVAAIVAPQGEIVGLPEIARFGWELVPRAAAEGCAATSPVWLGAATAEPDWQPPSTVAGRYALRVTALSARSAPVAQAKLDLVFVPARLEGELVLEGTPPAGIAPDYEVFAAGAEAPLLHLSQAGAFEAPLCALPAAGLPAAFAGSRREAGWAARSEIVAAVAVSPGAYRLPRPLTLRFSWPVSIAVAAVDLAGAPVVAAVELGIAGVTLPLVPGESATRLLRDQDEVTARARFTLPSGTVEAAAEPLVYTPEKGERLTLRVQLPFYGAGGLNIAGRFTAPDGAKRIGPVVEGIVAGDVVGRQRVGADGRFALVNDQPVRGGDRIALDAVLADAEGRLLSPAVPVVASAAGPTVDLGEITVAPHGIEQGPVRVRATDWAGAPLPAEGTSVSIGGQAARPVTEGFEGSWTFTRRDETVEVKAAYAMPAGATVAETATLSLPGLPMPGVALTPPDPVDLRLKLYLPGSLLVAGRLEGDRALPEQVKLRVEQGDPALVRTWLVAVDEPFSLPLAVPVRLLFPIRVTASAQTATAEYVGSGFAPAPALAGAGGVAVAEVGRIVLRAVPRRVALPDLAGLDVEVAARRLEQAGLKMQVMAERRRPERSADAGRVLRQEPRPASRVAIGSTVSVWAYDAFRRATVPDLHGLGVREAAALLREYGLSVRRQPLGRAPKGERGGVIVGQSPPHPAQVAPGTAVTISYYDG